MKTKTINRSSTPSEYYRTLRPENFSDSENTFKLVLTRETLAYILSQITTNQKQDEFETFCRKLAEKFIAPNIIPQVGPTGGGDGKTDFETHPVSDHIAERWFIPQNGWSKDEKWGFAISAKKEWKSKAKADVKKIVETKRGYTKVYFMTNQSPSSKLKKEAQDELINEYKIDVIILDGEWILEKIYGNDLIELAVDSLNLSDVYKEKIINVGENDLRRSKRLAEVEENISNPNRYHEYDFQLVEDALEAAILSRMLEKSKDEVLSKFERAFRFCDKVKNTRQKERLLYQRAWTYINWYDDYALFIDDYKQYKLLVSDASDISGVERYLNLLNLLRGLHASGNCDLSKLGIEIKKETEILKEVLNKYISNREKPSSGLIARTYKSILGLTESINLREPSETYLHELAEQFNQSKSHLEYPFDCFKDMIEALGDLLPINSEFDKLIDCIAEISEKRSSELTAGEMFLKRGGQKLEAKCYRESLVYFGKAVIKLAKEETPNGLYFSLRGLSQAYSDLGLPWAANSALICASSISFKSWYKTGVINRRSYSCTKQLLTNELFLGRLPSILNWHELFGILSAQLNVEDKEGDVPLIELLDGCLATRILNTNNKETALKLIPDLLDHQHLWLTQGAVLYKLGYTEIVLSDFFKGQQVNDEKGLDEFFKLSANQPFQDQMLYDTDFMSEDTITLTSKILGCRFVVRFEKNFELLLTAETVLAFFESFLATSFTDIYPHAEAITINIIQSTKEKLIRFQQKTNLPEYTFEINTFSFKNEKRDAIWNAMLEFISYILDKHFIIRELEKHLENLFKNEEIHDRLSLIFDHRTFTLDILGNEPKLFLEDWLKEKDFKAYPMKRPAPIVYRFEEGEKKGLPNKKMDPKNITHDRIMVHSIIDVKLWDQAKWQGFGVFTDSIGMGILLAFENIDAGKKIFDSWIERFGNEDKDEIIKITIVRGVNQNNPFNYRVQVSSNIDLKSVASGNLFQTASKFHDMTPQNPENLNNLIAEYNAIKEYRLCLAQVVDMGKTVVPHFDKSILKRNLVIRNAWEIGENDIDSVVILKGDIPVVPSNVIDAPVLALLKKK